MEKTSTTETISPPEAKPVSSPPPAPDTAAHAAADNSPAEPDHAHPRVETGSADKDPARTRVETPPASARVRKSRSAPACRTTSPAGWSWSTG